MNIASAEALYLIDTTSSDSLIPLQKKCQKSSPGYDLIAQLESVIYAPTDEIDDILQNELQAAISGCPNKEWVEMMLNQEHITNEDDLVSDVDGNNDFSF